MIHEVNIKMTGLTIDIRMPKEAIRTAIQMEQNYPGIHRKAIWEKVIFPRGIIDAPFSLFVQKPLFERKYKKMLEAYGNKIRNPSSQTFIDDIAKEEGINAHASIQPLNEDRVRYRGDLAIQGMGFVESESLFLAKPSFEYIITGGNS